MTCLPSLLSGSEVLRVTERIETVSPVPVSVPQSGIQVQRSCASRSALKHAIPDLAGLRLRDGVQRSCASRSALKLGGSILSRS